MLIQSERVFERINGWYGLWPKEVEKGMASVISTDMATDRATEEGFTSQPTEPIQPFNGASFLEQRYEKQ